MEQVVENGNIISDDAPKERFNAMDSNSLPRSLNKVKYKKWSPSWFCRACREKRIKYVRTTKSCNKNWAFGIWYFFELNMYAYGFFIFKFFSNYWYYYVWLISIYRAIYEENQSIRIQTHPLIDTQLLLLYHKISTNMPPFLKIILKIRLS